MAPGTRRGSERRMDAARYFGVWVRDGAPTNPRSTAPPRQTGWVLIRCGSDQCSGRWPPPCEIAMRGTRSHLDRDCTKGEAPSDWRHVEASGYATESADGTVEMILPDPRSPRPAVGFET